MASFHPQKSGQKLHTFPANQQKVKFAGRKKIDFFYNFYNNTIYFIINPRKSSLKTRLFKKNSILRTYREEKIWTVHISCTLPQEPKTMMANTRCRLANFTPVERYTIFHYTRAENTIFAF